MAKQLHELEPGEFWEDPTEKNIEMEDEYDRARREERGVVHQCSSGTMQPSISAVHVDEQQGSLVSIIRKITGEKVQRLPNGQIPEWDGPQDHEMAEGYTLPTLGVVGACEQDRQPILDTNIISMPPARPRNRTDFRSNDLSNTLVKPYEEEEGPHNPAMCNE